MTTTVTSNKRNISAQVHLNATDTIVVAGATGVSDIAIADEVLTGAYITQVFAGCTGGGSVTITRGGELIGAYDSTGWYDYAGCGMSLNINAADPVVVAITGTCYAFIELKKKGAGTSEYLVG